MEYTLEKLREGIALAQLSEQRKSLLETHWKTYLPQIKEYCRGIMVNWPAYPDNNGNLPLPQALSEEMQSVILVASYCFLTRPAKEVYLAKGYSEALWREAMPDVT